MPLKIPPAIATPLDKGGRGDLSTIYSIQEVCCVSPVLLPKLTPGDVIVLDNTSFHRSSLVEELAAEVGCEVW